MSGQVIIGNITVRCKKLAENYQRTNPEEGWNILCQQNEDHHADAL